MIVADGAADDLPTRLLSVVAEPQRLGTLDVTATATIGVARGDGSGDPANLLSEASLALAVARTPGPAGWRPPTPRSGPCELNRLRLAHELSRAVPDRELEVYYQPIVALPDRRIVGAEALIRWNHPARGRAHPRPLAGDRRRGRAAPRDRSQHARRGLPALRDAERRSVAAIRCG